MKSRNLIHTQNNQDQQPWREHKIILATCEMLWVDRGAVAVQV